ncbi:putative Histidine kinase [Syntrophobacter sp. SbD1]|nr:putative Histidine kinase [Syntrophobacter sp. SbD1]
MISEGLETAKTGHHSLTGESTGLPDSTFFRACFSRFPAPVIVADMQSNILFFNESAQTFTGCGLTAGDRLVCSDIFRNAENEQFSPIEECIKQGTLDEFKIHFRNHAGDWSCFLLSAQLVNDSCGNPAECVFILRTASSVAAGPAQSPQGGGTASRVSHSNLRRWQENLCKISRTSMLVSQDHIFASVIDHFPMPFFIVDTNLTITYMNDHMEKLTGFSRSEVVNRMSCAEVLRTSSCHTEDCLLKQAMEIGTPVAGMRHIICDRSGREIPVAVHCSMITDSENRVIGGFKAFRDITPLFEAEQKIRMLLEITQEGILMVDENDRVIYVNSKMVEILEHPEGDLIGKDVKGLLPPQLLSITRDLALKVDKQHYQAVRFCSTIQPAAPTSNREDRVFETCIVVARFGKGFNTCMYFQDITKRIQMERELLSANGFLNNIIKSSADGIVVADLKGDILIYNDSAERILGYSADEVIGRPGSLFKIANIEIAKENMRRMRSGDYGPTGKLTSTRVTLDRKDGEEVPVNFSAAIISEGGREIGTVGIFSDLREHLRMRKELEHTRRQLMQAEKIASIGRLAAGIAHEINNPLSGILIFADILLKDLPAHNPQWGADLQEIIDQTMRCKEIVARLLEFSRQSVGQRLNSEINAVIARSMELLSHQALFHNIEFVTDLQPDIPLMTCDPGQLQQVFINFILNAGTAMGGRGKITITSRFDPAYDEVTVEFADTGPGIPVEIMSKIFDPFFTTKEPGEGTGLGLSVAYGIIQQHGGDISVANSASGGAVFKVVLPLECPEKTTEFAY